nr:hypothetical protein [Tanacetum cinerariifolium]
MTNGIPSSVNIKQHYRIHSYRSNSSNTISKAAYFEMFINAGYKHQRLGNVAGARETVGSSMVQKSRIQCYNCKEYGHVARECQKPKRAKDAAYHKEKMLLYAVDSGPIFDTEPEQKVQNDDHYDVFAIECQHPEQSESVHKTYLIEQNVHDVIIESVDMNYDSEQIDQNDEDADLAKERELLASLIEKFKSEIEDFKNKNKSLTEANNKLSKENDLLYTDFKKSKAKLKRQDSIEYASEMELECAKVREMKNKLSAHQDTISILKQQKDAQIKIYKSRKDKEIEKVIDLENKVKKAKQANPRQYDIGCYNDNLALMLSPESDEVIRLEKESRSKLSHLIRPFDYAKLNSLYDLFVPQREKSSEQWFFSERSRISHINVQNEKKKASF